MLGMNPPKLKLKRQARRRRYQSAWIVPDGTYDRSECRLTNISRDGAQIVIAAAAEIPKHFALALVPNASQKRSCEVVWRKGQTVGIRFVS